MFQDVNDIPVIDYADRFYILENQTTHERIMIDREDVAYKQRRYKKMCRAFVNYTKIEGLRYYKHITLTQKVENYKPNFLNNFFNSMRRRYGKIAYIWTCETQERGVLHWHCIMAFTPDVDFQKEDILKIQQYWKFGNVDIKPVRKFWLGYIMKYITKALDTPLSEMFNLRKIGMSRIALYYRHTWGNLMRVIEWFDFHPENVNHTFKVDGYGIYTYFQEGWDYVKDYVYKLTDRWRLVATL